MRIFAAGLCALFLSMTSVKTAAETRNAGSFTPALTISSFGRLLPAALVTGPDAGLVSRVKDTVSPGWPWRARLVQTACLALAVYHEARGEPLSAQRAVAATILNRARSAAYPQTLCGVVYDGAARPFKCQFSFACDRRSDVPHNSESVAVSMAVALAVQKFSPDRIPSCFELATHYHRFDVHPVWSPKLNRLGQMGAHLFLASDRVIRRMANGALFRAGVSQCRRLVEYPSMSL